MNWARGLFRLWLTMSILWIGGILSIVALDGGFSTKTRVYDVEGSVRERYQVTAPATTSSEEAVSFAKLYPREACNQDKTGPGCQFPVQLEIPAREYNKAPLYAALSLPIFALVAGAGLYWALAGFGFRRSSLVKPR
ncbi:hypothetical protein [Bradyrhizobium sp. HKCCYLS20291]|uniref:hypothetical protein n=1 Tax=Bradyrhizobium sp. HKCCYLS20291 TaxID=3420766 RepID=UPI003EBFF217